MVERSLEARHPFLVVEPVDPIQAEVEPALRLWRCGRDGSRVSAEIEAIHCSVTLQPDEFGDP